MYTYLLGSRTHVIVYNQLNAQKRQEILFFSVPSRDTPSNWTCQRILKTSQLHGLCRVYVCGFVTRNALLVLLNSFEYSSIAYWEGTRRTWNLKRWCWMDRSPRHVSRFKQLYCSYIWLDLDNLLQQPVPYTNTTHKKGSCLTSRPCNRRYCSWYSLQIYWLLNIRDIVKTRKSHIKHNSHRKSHNFRYQVQMIYAIL